MTNEAKMLGISVIMMIGLNLLVAPLVTGEDGNTAIPDLTPPEDALISDEFTIENPEGGSWLVPDTVEQSASVFVQYLSGTFQMVRWFVGAIGSVIFGGLFVHPLLTLLNFVLIVVSVIALIKISPTT